jgi:hypothetical protein
MSNKTVAASLPLLIFATVNSMVAQTMGPTLVGAWEFTATPQPAASAAPPSIEGLATFTSDGTVIETDTLSIVARVSPGHGIWQPGPIPGGYLFVRFMSLRPNPNGTLNTKQTVTMFLTVNSTGHQFSGPYSIQVVDANGDTISTSKGTVEGKLIVHPLLP